MHFKQKLIWLLSAFALASCQPEAITEQGIAAAQTPFATVQEIMLSVIDPHVDPIWNAVTTTVTKEGVVEKAPASDEEWAALRKHAIALIEAGNLLLIPDRQVAAVGASTSIHPVEEDPKVIAALIKAKQADFAQKAVGLQEATKLALVAIDQKSAEGLLKAGEGIEKACEACHSAYWYPNDKRPVSFQSLGQAYAGFFAPLLSSRLALSHV